MERKSPSPIFFFDYFFGQKPLPFLKNKENTKQIQKINRIFSDYTFWRFKRGFRIFFLPVVLWLKKRKGSETFLKKFENENFADFLELNS